jgi:hypothetical protein
MSIATSKITVLVIVIGATAIALAGRWYVTSGAGREALATIDCARMRPTIAELQGARLELDQARVCAAMRELASATPIADGFEIDERDPWHYIARVRLQPVEDAWFLVFVARRSTGFRPEISLRHRRGAGWAIVGQFDGAPTLRRLGLLDRIDRAKLMSPASLEVRDQGQEL